MILKDKVAIVTGASRGIGAEVAHRLGSMGAVVIGTATTQAGMDLIESTLKENGIRGRGYVLNVQNKTVCEQMLVDLSSQYGTVEILVNNAGVTSDNLLFRLKDSDWDTVIDTNLSGIYRLCKIFARPMVKLRTGRIINITSVVGHLGNAGQTNYSAAKAGIVGFSKSLARELGGRGITVNCIAPGFIETDMTKTLNETQKKELLSQIPLSRMGKPTDVAHAVAYLASDEANYVTGSVLHVNGGILMD